MRALVQRVSEARVTVNRNIAGEIGQGLCVFLGIKHDDTLENVSKLAEKIIRLRIFPDLEGKMNLSLADISGELLIVSQFTLYGNTRRGNRPSYTEAARPEKARELYEAFTKACAERCRRVATGIFQEQMEVRLTNDGPVTLICYSGE